MAAPKLDAPRPQGHLDMPYSAPWADVDVLRTRGRGPGSSLSRQRL